jgi:predicted nucleic acid-binding protein
MERSPADRPKIALAQQLTASLREGRPLVVSTQALSELHFTLIRKGGQSRGEAARIISDWLGSCEVRGVTEEVIRSACTLAELHRLQTHDAVLLCSIAGHAHVLLSEDMQDGFTWNGVRVVNPFTDRSLVPMPS